MKRRKIRKRHVRRACGNLEKGAIFMDPHGLTLEEAAGPPRKPGRQL